MRNGQKGINSADQLSVLRMLTVPFFITAVLYYGPERSYLRFIALGIFMLAVISDFFDGRRARGKNQTTGTGALLDVLADKLLITSAFVCLSLPNKFTAEFSAFPLYLVIGVLSREVLVVLGVAILFLHSGEVKVHPSRRGKICMVLEMSAVLSLLLRFPPPPYNVLLWSAVILFAALSLYDYIRQGIILLNEQK